MDLKTIFSEGKKERRRRKELHKKNNELKGKQRILEENFHRLGKSAWEKRIALEKLPELKVSLEASQRELEILDERISKLQEQIGQNEARKKEETDFFEREKKNFEQNKANVVNRLNAEKTIKTKIEQAIAEAESQLKQIARKREELQRSLTEPTTTSERRAQIDRDLIGLSEEEKRLLETIKSKREELQNQNIRLQPIEKELTDVQQQIDQLQAKRREVLGTIETELTRLRKELDNFNRQKKDTSQQREESFRILGEKLASTGELPPELNQELSAVRETEQSIAAIKTELELLEKQKDQTALKAYRIMQLIIWGGLFILLILIIILFTFLRPEKKVSPLKITAPEIAKNLERVERNLRDLQSVSDKDSAKGTPLATDSDLNIVLVDVPGWEKEPPRYEKINLGEVESASSRTVYRNQQGSEIKVEVTDTYSIAALLAPSRALIAMKIKVDDDSIFQQAGEYNGLPMIESLDKRNNTARIVLIIRDRYLINLETEAENGLELLKAFLPELKIKALL